MKVILSLLLLGITILHRRVYHATTADGAGYVVAWQHDLGKRASGRKTEFSKVFTKSLC